MCCKKGKDRLGPAAQAILLGARRICPAVLEMAPKPQQQIPSSDQPFPQPGDRVLRFERTWLDLVLAGTKTAEIRQAAPTISRTAHGPQRASPDALDLAAQAEHLTVAQESALLAWSRPTLQVAIQAWNDCWVAPSPLLFEANMRLLPEDFTATFELSPTSGSSSEQSSHDFARRTMLALQVAAGWRARQDKLLAAV